MKTMSIEEFLTWAYLVELPKAGGGRPSGPPGARAGWDPVARFGELLTEVDCALPLNRFGLAVDFSAEGGPHADALALHAAVVDLDAMGLMLPEDWNPLEDIDDGDPLYAAAVARGVERITRVERDGARVLSIRPSDLVRRHAILGGAPDTACERPVRKIERENGRPKWFMRVLRPQPTVSGDEIMVEVEVDGFDRRRRMPYPAAYQKPYLDPDPVDVVVARAEYEIWRSALDLVMAVVGPMEGRDIMATRWPRRPWIEGEPKGPRILSAPASVEAAAPAVTGRRNRKRQNA